MKASTRTNALVAATAFCALSATANASVLSLAYDDLVTGATPASGSPWLTATVSDTSGGVNVALDINVVEPEFVTGLFFSLGSGADLSKVKDPSTTPDISLDACKGADPASTGPYQLCLGFAPKLHVADVLVNFDLAGLHVSDFVANSAGWFSVAHIQGVQPSCSAWVGAYSGKGTMAPASGSSCTSAPEPGTLSLLGAGLLAAFGARLKRRRPIA